MGSEEDQALLITVGELREIQARVRRLEALLITAGIMTAEDEPELGSGFVVE